MCYNHGNMGRHLPYGDMGRHVSDDITFLISNIFNEMFRVVAALLENSVCKI